jgi:hypothetical protein
MGEGGMPVRRWYACVGCEDKKMAAHLMKRSGATLCNENYGILPLRSISFELYVA